MAQPKPNDRSRPAFPDRFRGHVIVPDDSEYAEARSIWNGMIDRTPAVIAQCTGTADVATAVEYATENELPLAVRGGGHNVSGSAMCNDGLVVDLSNMTGVRVDPGARTAWVQGGATWADVDHETIPHGLATPGGVVSDTGVAGLTLGGGIGHLRRKYGLSCDNLRRIEVVTANGDIVTADQDTHSDLFWACRGGGGNFGIVTGFEFDLHPVGPEVATVFVVYPGDELAADLESYREYCEHAPRDVSTLMFAGDVPAEEPFPEEAWGDPMFAILGCHAADPDVGEDVLMPLREFREPIVDFSGLFDYRDLQSLLDEDYPDGDRYYWKSLHLPELTEDCLDRIAHWTAEAPSPASTVDVWHLGGAISDYDDATAYSARDAPYLLGVEANWSDPETDDENVQWVRDTIDDMRAFSDGTTYLNFPGASDDDNDLPATYGDAYERLRDVKTEYDPHNVFQFNQNIQPRT